MDKEENGWPPLTLCSLRSFTKLDQLPEEGNGFLENPADTQLVKLHPPCYRIKSFNTPSIRDRCWPLL
jgi:hypothetical protein